MPKRPVAESVLALFTSGDRAAAIMGDLAEMATTRSRLWLFAAYVRMLFSFTWRIVLALFVADVGREFMFNLADLYFRATPNTWRSTGSPYILGHMGPLLAGIMSTLWFAVPFAAVRYGVRDRFVRLTFGVALGTTVVFLFMPWISLLCAVAVAALATAALLSRTWRRPALALTAIGAAGLLLLAASSGLRFLLGHALAGHPHSLLARNTNMLTFQASLLLVAIVCARMHKLLLGGTRTA